jgi:hypothetical protein
MKPASRSERLLIFIFIAIIFAFPVTQVIIELRRGERPQALDVFRQKPTAAHLRAYERDLEDANVLAKALRPWVQYAQFTWLKDGGEKAWIGNDGWLFYGPGVQYLIERPDLRKGSSTPAQALQAIVSFRDDLAARGIRLLVMPVPNKESVYPERLSRRGSFPQGVVSEDTRSLLSGLRAAGVETVDLGVIFSQAKTQASLDDPLYLAQDSHWSPAGLSLAASTVAQRIEAKRWLQPGQVEYELKPVTERRTGDILRMLRVPALERQTPPEKIQCEQVIRCDTHKPYQDDQASDVLVLGDSFLRIYEKDEPGSAGFIAHLAGQLRRPLASIINDGGASTLVRQELSRRPALLASKKVVIWEFVERDIRLGTEGWQTIKLPADF